MNSVSSRSSRCLSAIGIALALVAGGAFADKPSWAGEGKHKEGKDRNKELHHREQGRDAERQGGSLVFSFSGEDRRLAMEYYGSQASKGKCPPGLAKKNNGCQAPGQAKKWRKGQALARDIEYYELPRELRVRLPAPPPNHRYVQVAGDILMIAIGTSMVVDALEDILR
jgi:Ni/Co efflux regulator RcnB